MSKNLFELFHKPCIIYTIKLYYQVSVIYVYKQIYNAKYSNKNNDNVSLMFFYKLVKKYHSKTLISPSTAQSRHIF